MLRRVEHWLRHSSRVFIRGGFQLGVQAWSLNTGSPQPHPSSSRGWAPLTLAPPPDRAAVMLSTEAAAPDGEFVRGGVWSKAPPLISPTP